MSAALLHRLLTPEECDELNQLLEAKSLANLGSPLAPPVAATKHTDAGSPCPETPALSSEDCPACENMRVALNWEDCIVRPCPHCRPDEALAFAASRAEADEAAHDTERCPPPDSWDLASEELNMAASLRPAPMTCPDCDGDGSHCEECGCP